MSSQYIRSLNCPTCYIKLFVCRSLVPHCTHRYFRIKQYVSSNVCQAVHVAPYSIEVAEVKLAEDVTFLVRTLSDYISPRVNYHRMTEANHAIIRSVVD